ncbi:PTS sugar transporter subunit IIC [Enorma massiliensis]|uniref:PTS fructose transporter subunit IIC n=1 Tax=Enorma massiliensis TaxID=1472761 RepID=A0A1Y3U5Z2_9ACTN|nr:PTS sugar transporter subunit IIC [Enorma massiliensis]MBM6782878.1 PTS sugar transporter subunit IIC [Enorma massiliensis]OUN44194.1 PTS fructose transporter subunit IIC [Enorma massiliensis]CDD39422.1 pTS system sorbose-specific iic component [Collinsella sp. CAG:398]SCI13745.1 PTS system N-acetylgalactosamine-specific EIIC component 1 [uncultured Collinsella sp.]
MIAWWQIILLTLYAGFQIMDELHWYSSAGSAVFSGFITGLIMGDMATGLYIGGSMQLTILGVGTFGGASRIDANSGTLIATAFAVSSGMDPEQALAVLGVPVAAILVYTDIAGRFANTFFGHMCDADVEKMNWGAYNVHYWLGAVSWMLSRMLPVFLALAFGQPVVEAITAALNGDFAWLGAGLTVAGGALPAVGFAILLRYLPVKKHIAYLILGFVIAALLGTLFTNVAGVAGDVATAAAATETAINGGDYNSLSMLTIALIGFALAYIYYVQNKAQAAAPAAAAAVEGDDDDEL